MNKKIIKLLSKKWTKYSELRFGQLLSNIILTYQYKEKELFNMDNLFYLTDNKLEQMINEYSIKK